MSANTDSGGGGTKVRNIRLLLIGLVLAALAGMYLWKELAVRKVSERAAVEMTEQHKASLQLATVPLVWAVRSEMIRGNLDQVNQYLVNFVREPNMKEVVLAKPDGVILLGTNKRLEGGRVADSFPESLMQVDRTMVSSLDNRGLVSASPIMGLDRKLGVLIVVYKPPSLSDGD